jgi:hypothetical protein
LQQEALDPQNHCYSISLAVALKPIFWFLTELGSLIFYVQMRAVHETLVDLIPEHLTWTFVCFGYEIAPESGTIDCGEQIILQGSDSVQASILASSCG